MKKVTCLIIVLSSLLLVSCGAKTPADSTSTFSEITETIATTVAETIATTTATAETTMATETTVPAIIPKSPADEIPTQKVFRNSNGDMLIEVTINGYKSEILGLDFYVKNTEVIEVTAKVTNISDDPDTVIYFWDDCMYEDSCTGTVHNHTFFYDLTANDVTHIGGLSGHVHIPWYQNFTLKNGESHERTSFFIIGELSNDCDVELTNEKWSDLRWEYKGIKIYDGIYTDGKCEFSGNARFEYDRRKTERYDDRSYKIACDISFIVLDCR